MMIHTHILLSLTLLFFHLVLVCLQEIIYAETPCRFASIMPEWSPCNCHSVDSSVLLECDSARLGRIPVLPSTLSNTLSLSIQHDHLPNITSDSFGTAEITSIDLAHNGIRTVNANAFRGLEDTLRELRLSDNKLTELPSWSLTYLSQLETLDLQVNSISTIRAKAFDETQLTSLQFLYLNDNEIETLPSQCMRRLRLLVLSLARNRISSLEKLCLPPPLTILDLSSNLLEEIPYLALQEQPNIREINLEGNRISKTDYNPEVMLANEMKLLLRNNRISALSSISLQSFRKFSELDLSYNEISSLSHQTFETIGQVKDLNLAHNKITFIKKGTFENIGKSLDKLNLAWNNMHALPEALNDLRVLTSLSMEGNKLSRVDATLMSSFKDSLTEISLSYNHLHVLPADLIQSMSKLKVIDLCKNRIDVISTRWRVDNLHKILLAANFLTAVDLPTFFAHSPLLTLLDLSFNRIERLGIGAFGNLPLLDTLFLQHNRLKILPRDALITQTALHTLVLDDNEMFSLPPLSTAPWPRLSRLSLHGNLISEMNERAFSTAFSLSYLDLSSNLLQKLKTHTFEFLQVHTVLLSHNLLEELQPLGFAHMMDMRVIDLSHNKLRVLSSHTFYNVSSIDRVLLAHNKLENVEAGAFYEVRRVGSLEAQNNRLKIFSCKAFSSFVRVEQIDFSFNQLTSLDLSCLKSSLSRIDLSHNQLQSVEENLLEGAPMLNFVSLAQNALLSLSSGAFETLRSLRNIDLSHNHLRIIRRSTFAHQHLLENLDLSYNALVSLHSEVLGVNNLRGLSLAGNQLTSIPVEGLQSVSSSLEWLDLAKNFITSIDAIQFASLTNLKKLDLSSNRLQSLEEEIFASLPQLQILNLRDNPLSSWHPQAFKGLSPRIKTVDLSETGLFSIPRFDSQELRELHLSKNNIKELDSSQFEGIPRIRVLNVSENTLTTLPDNLFANLTLLSELDLSGNPILTLTDPLFSNIPRLTKLLINNMPQLHALPNAETFTRMTSMQHLEMTSLPLAIINYNISSILASLPPLRKLSLQINDAKLGEQLVIADYRALKSLSITGSVLKEIDVGAFSHLRGYDLELAVVNTSITEWPPAIFDTLTGIQKLSLSLDNNQLSTLSPFLHTNKPLLNRHATLLQHISLKNNPIVCDCSMKWFEEWATEEQPCHGFSFQDLTCSAYIHARFLLYLIPYLFMFFPLLF